MVFFNAALTGLWGNQLWIHRSDYTDSQLHRGRPIHWSRKWSVRAFFMSCCRFLQHVSIACYAERCISYSKSVRPSVCPSVTRWHWVKTSQATIMGSSLEDSPMILVSSRLTSRKNCKGNIGSEGAEWERGRKNRQFLANKSPYLRNGAR